MTSNTDFGGDIPQDEQTAAGYDGETSSGDPAVSPGEISLRRETRSELCSPRIEASPGAPGLQALVAYMWRLKPPPPIDDRSAAGNAAILSMTDIDVPEPVKMGLWLTWVC